MFLSSYSYLLPVNPWYQNKEEIIPTPEKSKVISSTALGVENPNEVLKIFMDPDVEIFNDIPDGNKSNGPYFVLKNPNLERYQNRQPFKHPKDDINNYEKRVSKTFSGAGRPSLVYRSGAIAM